MDRQAGQGEPEGPGDTDAREDAQHASRGRQEGGLQQEKRQHLAAARAERAQQADLAVLSFTEIHIMVRMPMAPTTSEIPPIAPTAEVTTPMMRFSTVSIDSWVVIVKSSSPWCRSVMMRLISRTT